SPARDRMLDLEELGEALAKVGRVERNAYLLTLTTEGYEITIFPNGRAIVKGTTDVQAARSLYSKYVGN
ncbi:MAG: thiazole biosynthesis adenylyltransferase ThiF, partial [Candidatus Geothermincolia bacterium]